MFGFLNKLFGGSKSDKDIKKLSPEVEKSNAVFAQLQSLSNDALRAKTLEFKQRIQQHTADELAQIEQKKAEADAQSDIYTKEDIFKEIDALYLERNKQIEVILDQILPEAFAVVKEAALRFTNNAQLISTATELDRNLAVSKAYVKIEGDQSIFNNSWLAAGGQVSWNMVHYDVQLIGGTVLHQGKIAEMATGEGKTLVSTLPVYLNALAGLGVHLVTVNDYLARRDSEWNGTLFEWLGLTVDCIDKHQPNSEERRNAYLADITYGTNNEFGFDYLRDNMVHNPSEMVQRRHHFAILDEVDSVLIDDARTPLIISGPVPRGDEQEFQLLKPRIEKLVEAQKRIATDSLVQAKKLIAEGKDDKETGGLMLYRAYKALPKHGSLIKFLSEPGIKQILQKTENYYMGEQQRNMPIVDSELYFTIDEKNNSVDLTQKGLQLLSTASADANFFVLPDISVLMNNIDVSASSAEEKTAQKAILLQEYSVKADRIHTVQQLLKAYTLFDIDVDYVVMDEKVKIVDEQTGRILDGRRYSDGLHQAIEAKENVTIEAATQTFATITLQNYFRMYHKLAGMTGTAETEAAELWSIYKLDVVKVPTNIPIKRNDQEDLIYKTKREKYRAIIDEVKELSAAGRPVLVGTTNVEVSELLSKMLTFEKIPHNVLNAKQHAREAEIVSGAGLTSAITIATNMAGRGTDIKLASEVKGAGGLAIIGTERHDSRRVDRQLRGRAGRQGDPGSSKFYISLEDELMRLFGSERLSGIMDKLGHKEGDVIQHSMITKSIERAQKKVEENNFGIRKRLLEYDDVMNAQRDVIYKRRKNALFGDRLSIDIENAFADVATDVATSFAGSNAFADYKMECIRLFAIEPTITEQAFLGANADALTDSLYSDLKNFYTFKTKALAEQTYPVLSGIRAQNPNQQIDNVSIPFTDGIHGFNALANLDACLAPNSTEVANALERSATLALIDDGWKNHLRQMDELKQSVQMSSSTEQKDPLVIYKIEAFNLFKELISVTNKNIVSFLCKANLPVHEQQDIQQAQEQHTDMANMRTSHEEFGDDASEQAEMYDTREPVKQEPIKRDEPKIGRNDNCPCGSGKKFKACHGKGM
jgi:preprotein translocase subunit SecA